MTKPKYPSDTRPSDTKSVVLHRENDQRLLDHVNQIKGESRFWRAAGYFYLDFSEWLATQPDAPEPGRPFVYYRAWLESRSPAPLLPCPPAAIDPESIAAVVLPGMRAVVEAALSTALAGLSLPPLPLGEGRGEGFELADLFSSELVLE